MWPNSSDINEIIWVVLKPVLFFYEKILYAPKAIKSTKKHKKAAKAQKALKAQKRNQLKAQNANKRTKIKNALKNIWVEKSNLFAYLRFCVFCAREEKKHRK